MEKDQRINIRLNEQDKRIIFKLAESGNKSVSEVLRSMIREAAEHQSKGEHHREKQFA